jgi:hypothetical protein
MARLGQSGHFFTLELKASKKQSFLTMGQLLSSFDWLFFGDADAGERCAILYSIIESCRRHGVEPYTYLHDVLTRLPSMTNRQIKDIVPKAWAAATRNLTSTAA